MPPGHNVSADIKNPLIEMALGAKRIETHIVKVSTHPIEVKQKFSKYHKTASITKHVTFYCVVVRYLWSLGKRITGIHLDIDIKAPLLNNIHKKYIKNARVQKLINVIFRDTKRIIFTIFY